MGKIRVKTLGVGGSEDEMKKRDEKRRAAKRARKEGLDKAKASGKSKDGERVKAVASSEKEVAVVEKEPNKKDAKDKPAKKALSEKKKVAKSSKVRSKRYTELKSQIDRNITYELKEAIKLVQSTSKASFEGSIEAHINMRKKAKELSLKAPKKSKDPKAPKTVQIAFEKKQPVAHAVLGKASAKEADIVKEYNAVIKLIGPHNIRKLTLASTMGPGVKVTV